MDALTLLLHGVPLRRHIQQLPVGPHGYVDDWLWRFRAPVLSMVACMALVAVGCPLSWHKPAFGSSLRWIGLIHNFKDRTFIIPEIKQNARRNSYNRCARQAVALTDSNYKAALSC